MEGLRLIGRMLYTLSLGDQEGTEGPAAEMVGYFLIEETELDASVMCERVRLREANLCFGSLSH